TSLIRPARAAWDSDGDPAFRRTPQQQRAYEGLIDTADILYGMSDLTAEALARTVRANPRLRWVQAMAAGAGGQVRAAELTAEELERVAFTTTAGVHARPLSEFVLLGLLAGAKGLPKLSRLQREHVWQTRWGMGMIDGSTTIVLGLGGIGTRV